MHNTENRVSSFADSDLIIRNPQGLNRTHELLYYLSRFLYSWLSLKIISRNQKTWTWTDYHQDVRTVAKAFISLGFAR